MGMDIGARIKKGNLYDFVNDSDLQDFRCIQAYRRVLHAIGVDFSEGIATFQGKTLAKAIMDLRSLYRVTSDAETMEDIETIGKFFHKCYDRRYAVTIV